MRLGKMGDVEVDKYEVRDHFAYDLSSAFGLSPCPVTVGDTLLRKVLLKSFVLN